MAPGGEPDFALSLRLRDASSGRPLYRLVGLVQQAAPGNVSTRRSSIGSRIHATQKRRVGQNNALGNSREPPATN
jgi:hypothetical protein